jgi:Tol biopolymer transport system component
LAVAFWFYPFKQKSSLSLKGIIFDPEISNHNSRVKKKGDTTNAVWTLSKTNETLTPIAGLAPDPESYIKVESISPGHKWLAYSTGKLGQESPALWISSMDGSVQQQILPDMNNYGNFVSWVDDGTIVIVGHPDNREEPTPVIALNPSNQEQTPLPPLPEDAILLVLQRDFVLLRDFMYYYETLPLRRVEGRLSNCERVRLR